MRAAFAESDIQETPLPATIKRYPLYQTVPCLPSDFVKTVNVKSYPLKALAVVWEFTID